MAYYSPIVPTPFDLMTYALNRIAHSHKVREQKEQAEKQAENSCQAPPTKPSTHQVDCYSSNRPQTLSKQQQNTAENITETVISSSDTTGLLSTISHQSTQPVQEKSLQQAKAENTAEKPSDNKATVIKNTAQLSTIPRQIATQQAENDSTIWPAISACLGNITLVWHITAMSKQEKDLLRRSQPNYYDTLDLCKQRPRISR
ncbi:hypothetical protein HO173_006726 [Letharia columbiana]|uniref:Uncharacterized protein n=1 Tax=Letharia columbiana TaxID=112416 RepID=A0A8H6FUM3_9LECA|nr:uncharacterized protein HO173_006726 [Letharia columbiana]KAF6235099.1 hypothetical protein HO173_006726 [Letharia columbiana]